MMRTRWGHLQFLLVGLLAVLAWGKKDRPDLEETEFESSPVNLFYLEDSDVVFTIDPESATLYSSTDAGVKWRPHEQSKGKVLTATPNPFDNNVVIVLGSGTTHWITKNQGNEWESFESSDRPLRARPAIAFHAADPNRMLMYVETCIGHFCAEKITYTTDGFKSKPTQLPLKALSCLWAKSTPNFAEHNRDLSDDELLCMVEGKFSFFETDNRLLRSSDYFVKDKTEPTMSDDRAVSGIINIAAVKSYIVAAAKSEGSRELAMYVTDDTKTWHRAVFQDHSLEQDAFTLLESTNYSMQVDVQSGRMGSGLGELLTSNSNGTFFRKNIEHTHRGPHGFVDFEKIQNIQGIMMVNTVANWEEVQENYRTEKEITTQISFDDGRHWQSLEADGEKLHLHSVTEQRNSGRVFSSPAPGIVMGIGNTGKYLDAYDKGDTYVSDDAGLTWRRALKGPHLYEFGDQGAILVAIEDGETDEIKFSLNHGKDWTSVDLKDLDVKGKIRPISLTTTPDSTSLKFLMTAIKDKDEQIKHLIYALDFHGLHEKTCKNSDFEDWNARVDNEGNAICIMGHKQTFRRRKAGSECFIDDEFRDPVPTTEDCKCVETDFECDYERGFYRDEENGGCVPSQAFDVPDNECKSDDDTFMGPSGYRIVPGNTCVQQGGVELDAPKKWKCKDASAVKPVHDGITSEITKGFNKAERIEEYYYLERCKDCTGDDETVIMRTDEGEVFVSSDHGKTWVLKKTEKSVVAIYPHQYFHDSVYLITSSRVVYYSQNRGHDIHSFEAPEAPTREAQIMQFHPSQKDWLIWTGDKDRQTIAHVSKKGGDDWQTLLKSVRKCEFVYREGRASSKDLIYCEQHENESIDGPLSLMSSEDFFENKKELKRDVINFATMNEYIVVALHDEDQKSLKVDASIDGEVFADARFPSNFQVEHQQAYTVLDSSTHAVFLHVTVNNRERAEYGTILKSNSNGTSYVTSIGEVNRNALGYVDFEKMQGLEGVAVINRVANIDEVEAGETKQLKSYITHNDGADWELITTPEPPKDDPDAFDCKGTSEKCSLHLHGYTERKDPRDTFSSPSAVGLMVATGNVGESLGSRKEANTFLTRDGGVTWTMVFKGRWMWEFGDQGSVLVLVKESEPVKDISYSLDEGGSWETYTFSDTAMIVDDITTVPSDTSLNFLLWGTLGGDPTTVNIDFSGLPERAEQCHLDDNNPASSDSDYELWTPSHPLSEGCLFGRVMEYHHKKLDSKCYNGKDIDHLHDIKQNCTCTRRDFECDYNYEKQSDGSCDLVPGRERPNPEDACARDPTLTEYHAITGYRRIPITTCEGGKELDSTLQVFPCPNHLPEFKKNHGISGVGLFFAITLPIAAAAAIGYWVYKNWDRKFGRIRLGADGGGRASDPFDRNAPWVKYPIMALSGIFAVLAALPMVVGSLWHVVSTRFGRSRAGAGAFARQPYTSRNSFARGRGDYAIVDPDEDELLGESEDEV
nr:vacuolar protein sorting/targeting protein 10 [Quercus suber]